MLELVKGSKPVVGKTELLFLELGPTGVGKGNLARHLVANYGFDWFALGEIIRGNSPHRERWDIEHLAVKVRGASMDSDLGEDGLITEMVRTACQKMTNHRRVVLDGPCRTPEQAEAFLSIVDEVFGPSCRIFVAHLRILNKTPDEEERILIARNFGQDRGQRPDGKVEAIKKRIGTWKEKTVEAAKFLENSSRVHSFKTIDAVQLPEDVVARAVRQMKLGDPVREEVLAA